MKQFYNTLADERGLQISTIDSVHTVLHQVLDMAVDDCYLRSNPSDNVLRELKKAHQFETNRRKALTVAEQNLLLSGNISVSSSNVTGNPYSLNMSISFRLRSFRLLTSLPIALRKSLSL